MMSKKLKLSPWHDGSVKPVHEGVYQRDYSTSKHPDDATRGIQYCAFKDGKWHIFYDSIIEAKGSFIASSNKNLPWRGVLK
jgi:hypothetical protein